MNSRPSTRRCLLGLLCLVSGITQAEDKFDFKTHFFLKHYIGEWTTEGELKGADGNVVKLKQEWKAEVLAENTFTIEGRRELNDNVQTYKWTITRNPSTGLFEATHRASDDADSQRFEINFSEAEMKMEMTAILGGGNSRIVIVDTFPEKGRDTFEGKVTLTDEGGAVTLSGTLKNTRARKP